MGTKEVKIVPLNATELEKIKDKVLSTDRLRLIRDTFVFSCYTGLAYIDVATLTYNDIVIGVDHGQWINTTRTKTGTATRIPLLPEALKIMSQYKSHPKSIDSGRVLPVPSNQKANEYLKELADLCGITKKLTFHIARHAFATTVTLSNGVPLNSVSKMLGHKSIRQTEHYAKLVDNVISDDMKKLSIKLKKNSIDKQKAAGD